jgi:hypothetical protein
MSLPPDRSQAVALGPTAARVQLIRELAETLPRSHEAVARGRLKLRVGSIVWLSFSHDQEQIGFSFPKEFREALCEAEPHKYEMPTGSDLRFNWVHANLAALDDGELRELVVDAWASVVPQFVAREYAERRPV